MAWLLKFVGGLIIVVGSTAFFVVLIGLLGFVAKSENSPLGLGLLAGLTPFAAAAAAGEAMAVGAVLYVGGRALDYMKWSMRHGSPQRPSPSPALPHDAPYLEDRP